MLTDRRFALGITGKNRTNDLANFPFNHYTYDTDVSASSLPKNKIRRREMRRSLLAVMFLCVALVFTAQAMAQDAGQAGTGGWDKDGFQAKFDRAKEETFTGTVLSHDPMCHCLVVQTDQGELTVLDDYAKFMQEYNQAKGLKAGSKIKGIYKTVDHIHYLLSVSYT